MKKVILFLPFVVFADINPFTAGLNSNYGLTPQEKAILENKKMIIKISKDEDKLKKKIDDFNSKFIILNQSINDIQTKFSSLNSLLLEIDKTHQKIAYLNSKIKELDKVESLEKNITKLYKELNNIKKEQNNLKLAINNITKIQNENFKYLTESIKTILNQLNNISTSSMSASEAFIRAKKMFINKNYDEAEKLFLFTYSKRYYPATSLYYLGEIEYNKHNYKKALEYYKKCISVYPKRASFTSKLLFHTGIAFSKIGNKEASKLTFLKLINDYPDTIYAKEAKKYLEKNN